MMKYTTTADENTMARPSGYSKEIAEQLCERLSTSKEGLGIICQDESLPDVRTVWRWVAKYPEFTDMYAVSRGFQTELMYDDLLTIPNMPLTHNGKEVEDGGVMLEGAAMIAEVNRRKLLCDNIKFILMKLQPKRFGDNRNVNVDVKVRRQLTDEQFERLLAEADKPEIEDIDHEDVK